MSRRQKSKDAGLVNRQLAANLTKRRDELGLSKADLARRAGVSTSAISALESGKREPLSSTLLKVASALDWEVSDLLGGVNWVTPNHRDKRGHFERKRRGR